MREKCLQKDWVLLVAVLVLGPVWVRLALVAVLFVVRLALYLSLFMLMFDYKILAGECKVYTTIKEDITMATGTEC